MTEEAKKDELAGKSMIEMTTQVVAAYLLSLIHISEPTRPY